MEYRELITLAAEAREKAYAPYSRFLVGAALLTEDGKVYTGCNVENAAFTPTNCAERTAFFKAVSEGERSFSALAVVGGREGEQPSLCTPCGVCRQVIAEFCPPDFPVVLGTPEAFEIRRFSELLPFAFSPKNLQ